MGFINSAVTTTLVARLTPTGRSKLLSSSTDLIVTFSIGDSDANYTTPLPLTTGEVPGSGGDLGVGGTANNSVTNDIVFQSTVTADEFGNLQKNVESSSSAITSTEEVIGTPVLSASSLTFDLVNRNNITFDSKVNLFHSFGLPITEVDKLIFSGTPSSSGGFSDTAYSGLNQDDILVIGIDNADYGEVLDGKTVKLDLPTTASTFTIYGTFQNRLASLTAQDANTDETSSESEVFGDNITFLFSVRCKNLFKLLFSLVSFEITSSANPLKWFSSLFFKR